MKKYLYSILAAGMLLGTSCSGNELVEATGGESQQVTYTINLPGTESRAIEEEVYVGDGYYADRLIYAMYETGAHEKGVLVTGFVEDGKGTEKDGKFTVNLTLAKDISYDILFMAYDPDNCAFNINNTDASENNLKALTMKSGLVANKEHYDAFVGKFLGQNIYTKDKSVDLIRPFAQVNAATSLTDLEAVKDLKSVVTSSKFTIYGAPNQLNIFDGSVSGTTTHVYQQAPILTKYDAKENEYPKNEVLEINNEDWYYLSMAYVLAGNQSNTYDADFEFYREDNKPVSSVSVTSMPIQANYRTNVLGNLLTQAENYTISILAGFEGNHSAEPAPKVVVEDESDLQTAIESAKENTPTVIELGDNVVLGETTFSGRSRTAENSALYIAEDQIITINLNGFTISQTKACTAAYSMIENHGKLTIVDRSEKADGTLSFRDSGKGDPNFGWGSYTILNNGELILENGIIQNATHKMSHASYAIDNRSSFTMNGGKVLHENNYAIRQIAKAKNIIKVNGGEIIGTRAIWIQLPDSDTTKAPEVELNVTDGTLTGTGESEEYKLALYSYSYGNGMQNVKINISGGTFNGDIALTGGKNKENIETLTITDGTFDGGIYSYGDETKAMETINITGGTFTSAAKEYTDEALLAEGYMFEANGDNYIVTKAPEPVEVASITELLDALSSDEALPIFVTATIQIPAGETVELDLNGKTVTSAYQEGSDSKHIYPLDIYGELTIKDTKGNGTIWGRGIFVQESSKLTIEGGSIYGIDSNGGSALFQYGGDIIIKGGHIEQQAEGTYNFAINAVGGSVSVNGGWIGGNHGAIAAGGASVEINAGELVCTGTEGMTDNVVYSYGDGSITINGGNFTADNDGPAGGACVYDANGKVTINGGNFSNSSGGDVWGTTGTTIKGGTFMNLTETDHIADGYKLIKNENGSGTVQKIIMDETGLKAAFEAGGNILLGAAITISETLVLAEGKTAVLNLNGKTLSHSDEVNKYAINNHGTLTIKGNGIVNARGIYNGYGNGGENVASAKLTIENGTFNPKGTNGGAAIFNYGTVEIKGGTFTTAGLYSLSNQSGSTMIIDNATVTGGIYNVGELLTVNGGEIKTTRAESSHAIYHNGTELIVNGGTFMGNGNEVINANSSVATINGGTFTKDPDGKTSYLMAGSNMIINGGTFNAHTSNPAGHPVRSDVIVKGGTFNYKHTNIAAGYKIVDNGNGTWTVVEE